MPAKVYHYDLYGKRKDKYEFLANNSVSTVNWTELDPDPKYHFFVPKDFGEQGEYEKGVKISELFEVFNSGVETAKDSFIIKFSEKEIYGLKTLIKDYEIDEISRKTGFDKKYKIEQCKKDILSNEVTIKAINYRPFDMRFTMYSNLSQGVLWRPRHDTSKHFLQENLGLIAKRGFDEINSAPCFISNSIIDRRGWTRPGMQGAESLIPLYLYPENGGGVGEKLVFPKSDNHNFHNGELKFAATKPKPNFNPKIIKQIEEALGMELDWEAGIGESYSPLLAKGWQSQTDGVVSGQIKNKNTPRSNERTPLKEGDLEQFTPTDLLDYIYAVLHSPSYREKYKEFLKIDFPRVPFSNSSFQGGGTEGDGGINVKDRFWKLVKLGSKLRKLHLMEGINPLELEQGEISGEGGNLVEKVRFETPKIKDVGYLEENPQNSAILDPLKGVSGKVWINDTKYFDNVPENVWNFYIGGYQPAQKWLKDRKGRELSFDDILHYQKIVYVLGETDRVMEEIEKILNKVLSS